MTFAVGDKVRSTIYATSWTGEIIELFPYPFCRVRYGENMEAILNMNEMLAVEDAPMTPPPEAEQTQDTLNEFTERSPRREGNAARVQQIRERVDARTPVDWQANEDSFLYEVFYVDEEESDDDIHHVAHFENEADAVFVANAPDDIRFLLAALADARTRAQEAEAALADVLGECFYIKLDRHDDEYCDYCHAKLNPGDHYENCKVNEWYAVLAASRPPASDGGV